MKITLEIEPVNSEAEELAVQEIFRLFQKSPIKSQYKIILEE